MTNPTPNPIWSRLTTAARQIHDDRDTSAPYGFATRVAALAFAVERRSASLVDRFALRALGVASLVALFSVILNYREITSLNNPTATTAVASVQYYEPYAQDDAVSIVLDLAD